MRKHHLRKPHNTPNRQLDYILIAVIVFVAAVLQTGAGGLVAISTATDFFDIISYGFRSLLVLFTPFRKPQDQKKFYEFKLERQAKRGGAKWFLLLSGLTLLGLSLLCLGLYYWL